MLDCKSHAIRHPQHGGRATLRLLRRLRIRSEAFGPAITSAVLTNMAVAFPDQKLSHGGTIFGGLVRIMSKPAPDFDPDRLVSVLQTRTADEWGAFLTKLTSGDARAIALRDAFMDAYNNQASSEDA
jgi:hypothetical protein